MQLTGMEQKPIPTQSGHTALSFLRGSSVMAGRRWRPNDCASWSTSPTPRGASASWSAPQALRQALYRRRHEPIAVVGTWLRRVMQGYFNYHAVPGDNLRLSRFRSGESSWFSNRAATTASAGFPVIAGVVLAGGSGPNAVLRDSRKRTFSSAEG